MSSYSFQDIVASMTGPGGVVNLGAGSAVAEEGIDIEPVADQSTMTIGASGDAMHSLSADHSSTVTLRYLKTSAVNAILQIMYNVQTASSILHGKNVISIRDISRGDSITLLQVAFKKRPKISYAKEGGMVEWTFDAGKTVQILGVGIPEII